MQQINLYQDILQEQKAPTQTFWYASGIGLLILLVLIYGVLQSWQVQQLKKNLQSRQTQLETATSTLTLLQKQYPKSSPEPLLANEIERLKNIYRSMESVIDLLADQTTDKNRGFSHYFQALAEQSIASIWLTDINIDVTADQIRLQGSTYVPDQLPVFTTRLNKEASFKGHHFAHLHMQASDNDAQQIDFIISSTINIVKYR